MGQAIQAATPGILCRPMTCCSSTTTTDVMDEFLCSSQSATGMLRSTDEEPSPSSARSWQRSAKEHLARFSVPLLCLTATYDPEGTQQKAKLVRMLETHCTWRINAEQAIDPDGSWARILGRHPQCKQWSLNLDTVRSMYGSAVLEMRIGSATDGHSTFCSSHEGSNLAQEDVELDFHSGQLRVPMWLVSNSVSLWQALSCLTQTRLTKTLKSDGASCQFCLIWTFGEQSMPALLFRVETKIQGVWCQRDLPFGCADGMDKSSQRTKSRRDDESTCYRYDTAAVDEDDQVFPHQ